MEALVQTLTNRWKEWQLRGLVLLSLIFQTILIVVGNRRKYSNQLLVRFAVWVAYLAADTVATMALGIISNDLGDTSHNGELDANIELHVFWAPFLLLHLGGPDTITAYSLEDDELWLRHLLGLALQTGVALYTFLMAWRGSHLSILSTLMVFVGLSKYAERTWVLRSASSEQIKGSVIARRDLPGPSNPNLLKEYDNLSSEKAFEVVAMELAFMYDLLYTKASVVYSRWGLTLRCINLSLTCIVLVLFSLADDKHSTGHSFLILDLVWLSLHKRTSILKVITSIQLFKNPRWSNSMAQYNQLSFALREKPMIYDPILSQVKPHLYHRILKLFKCLGIVEKQEKERDVTKEVISNSLKEWIFKHLKERLKVKATVHETSDVGRQKFAVEIYGHGELKWSMEKGFDERILIWHIATDICYIALQQKWNLIADTWVEMLAHAATHCEGSQHRQQLRRGGQLLTHIWLLMAHLGLTDHFQIPQPRDITRLTAK
ncbi:hypothetical protein CRYUN_Cryun31cG0067500 [Craigia yunnanensis]